MRQHHVTVCVAYLVVTIIVCSVASHSEGVTLTHPNMTKSLKGVGALIEVSAVTRQVHTFMKERHVTSEELGIGVHAVYVVREFIGMTQIDFLIHLPAHGTSFLRHHGEDGGKGKKTQNHQHHDSVPSYSVMS